MLSKRTVIGIRATALLTAIVGIINVFSAVTPGLADRIARIDGIFSIEVRHYGHLFAALSGFFLLTLALNLSRRKRLAWLLTVILLIISILSHLVKGLDVEEGLISGVLLIQLLLLRKAFTARSDRPSIAQGVRVLIGALFFTIAYGTVGFYLLDTHYHINYNFFEALQQTLAMFFTEDNAGLSPKTRFGQFFADSIYIIGAVTSLYALFTLFRPVILHDSPATRIQRERAKDIAEKYGRSSLARFTLFEDKFYFFSPSGQSFIAYVPKGRGAIALGDPIGPDNERQETITAFVQFCQENDWYPAFYQVLPDDLELYRRTGFQTLKIGEEAIIDLKEFSLQGKSNKNQRNIINRFTKQGNAVRFYDPPIADEILSRLKVVSDEWLQTVRGSEKKFSLGWFNHEYLKDCSIATVETAGGEIIAFANVVPEYQLNEITIDLMRFKKDLESGTMEFLILSMLQNFKEKGYDSFNFGLSALAGVGETPNANRLEKVLAYLYKHLNQFYNFQGLHTYKAKFHPRWEPRYLIYPSHRVLPEVVVALIRADSGDRLLDYFKPGS
ncbi:phosphatidylglycerol lysyltransferase domain-containing protein [Pannus brasiliensis CCIBt3594]|uniref:Phosphatidylglycerol lysyltransferase domain-containing protein n=1 Tax=Pannus brasiliensis CCIBt3594 TaxID=1427578 RepID=A0AAW9QT26_9CHRO